VLVSILTAVIILGAEHLFGRILFLDMMEKYFGIEKLIEMNPALNERIVTAFLRTANSHLPWWLLAHSALTIYAAAKWNKWLWMTIRVPGFYAMLFVAGKVMAGVVQTG